VNTRRARSLLCIRNTPFVKGSVSGQDGRIKIIEAIPSPEEAWAVRRCHIET